MPERMSVYHTGTCCSSVPLSLHAVQYSPAVLCCAVSQRCCRSLQVVVTQWGWWMPQNWQVGTQPQTM
jgi:hypothetical protein